MSESVDRAESVDWAQLAAGLAQMSRDLLAQESLAQTLDRIVEYAVELVDGCDAAGIMVVREGRVYTLAATDNVVRASDRMQQDLGEGPCFDATRTKHEVYRIADLTTTELRWPRYAPKAADLGIGSAMGFLLHTTDRDNLGALDLYSARPNTFTAAHEQVGWMLASHAAVAMAGSQHEQNLHDALHSRQVIGIATGIVMERHRLTEPDAFARIVAVSQNSNTKVRDLARAIVDTGEFPDLPA